MIDYIVELDGDVDIREQIFYKLADAKMPLMLMQSADPSLEEIFLKLTNDTQYNRRGAAK